MLPSTIAGPVIAVAGTTYTLTIAVLTSASIEFGSRLLRNILLYRSKQVVLGAYVSAFMYGLLVMHTIGDPGGGAQDHEHHLNQLVEIAVRAIAGDQRSVHRRAVHRSPDRGAPCVRAARST
jgi:uncharacterized membrane protein